MVGHDLADTITDLAERRLLVAEPALREVRRVTVTVCTPRGDAEAVTFRPSADGPADERVIRGMHPLTAQRLNLSVERVRQLAKAGRIRCQETDLGRLFDPAEVEAFARTRVRYGRTAPATPAEDPPAR